MKRLLLALSLAASLSAQAFAFGGQGHRAIGKIAENHLNDNAKKGVTKVLGSTDLAGVATWPDDLKRAAKGEGPLANDAEAGKFNHDHPDNGNWHFVNLPLGSASYTDNGPFSNDSDIVHMINECIRTLESTTANPKFTKLQALRFLVHLVGDIHQPLHVATGYYTFDGQEMPHLVDNPDQALGELDDRGGNDLFYAAGDELHALWDSGLVQDVAGGTGHLQLANAIEADLANPNWRKAHPKGWDTPGNYHMWAETWAGESLLQAREAYRGIKFGDTTFDSHNRIRRMAITLPSGYENNQVDRETFQVALAGAHLANLLNQIKWK